MIQETVLAESGVDSIARRLDPAAGPWAKPNRVALGATILVLLALPWVLTNFSTGRFALHLLILFFVWGIVTQSWNLILGVGGIFSFAQVAFFVIGGLASGAAAQQLGLSPFITIWFAPIAATIAALIIGLPSLRLRGPYVVLLTLAFAELVRNFATQGPKWIAGGGYGLRDVPKFGFEDMLGTSTGRVAYYYIALLIFMITTYVIWRIFHSPIGMSFRALRDSETYATSRGVDPFRFKMLLFALSAFFTGLAGGFLVHYKGLAVAGDPQLPAYDQPAGDGRAGRVGHLLGADPRHGAVDCAARNTAGAPGQLAHDGHGLVPGPDRRLCARRSVPAAVARLQEALWPEG